MSGFDVKCFFSMLQLFGICSDFGFFHVSLILYIQRKGNFDVGLFPVVYDCSVSAFRLPLHRLNHVMFCLQSHQ